MGEKGRKARDSGATRAQLLAAASTLMTEQQEDDISFRALEERSGLNPALVKYYFGSKNGMMMALMKQAMLPSLERLTDLVESDLPADEKLVLHIKAIVNTYFHHPYLGRLLHRLPRLEGGKYGEEVARDIVTPLAHAQRQILSEGEQAGLFRSVDPMAFYFHVTGACDLIFHGKYALKHAFGVSHFTKAMKDKFSREVCDLVLHGLIKTSGKDL